MDVLIDGFLLGAPEMLSLGLATCTTCRRHGWSVFRTLTSVAGIGACFVLGAAIAAGILGGLSGPWLAGVIAFGLAVLLYLVT